jgi:hypothetical protein
LSKFQSFSDLLKRISYSKRLTTKDGCLSFKGGCMFKKKTSGALAIVVILGAILLSFQNCAKTNFASSNDDGGVLKLEGDGSLASTNNIEPAEVPPAPASQPAPPAPAPASQPTPPVVTAPPPQPTPSHESTVPVVADNESPDSSPLVECELAGAKKKIVFGSNDLLPGTNASSSRICMSEDACLKIVNAYASERDCQLVSGPAAAGASASRQCTMVFPGSKGTCHNAKILSDSDIESILGKMSK